MIFGWIRLGKGKRRSQSRIGLTQRSKSKSRLPSLESLEDRQLLSCNLPEAVISQLPPIESASCNRVFHVRPDGNDNNDGLSEETAFRTWLPFGWTWDSTDHPKADHVGKIQLEANDKVIFWPGLYSAEYQTPTDARQGFVRGFYIRNVQGTEAEPIEVLGMRGAVLDLQPTQPSDEYPTMVIANSEHVRVSGLEFTGMGKALRVTESNDVAVTHNWFHDIDGTDNNNMEPLYLTFNSGSIDVANNLFTNNFDRTNADTGGQRTGNSRHIGAYSNDGAVLRVNNNLFVNDADISSPIQGSGVVTKHGSDSDFIVDHNLFYQIADSSIGSANARFSAHHNLMLDSGPIVLKNFGGRTYFNEIDIRNNTQVNSDGAVIYRMNHIDGGTSYYDSHPIDSFDDLGNFAFHGNIVTERADVTNPTFLLGSYLGDDGPEVIRKVTEGNLLSFEGNVYRSSGGFSASWWRARSQYVTPHMRLDSFDDWQRGGFDQRGTNEDPHLNEVFQPSNAQTSSAGWYSGESARLTLLTIVDGEVAIAPTIEEGEEVTFAVVRSGADIRLDESLVVSIGASSGSDIRLPQSVTIEAGESVARFSAEILRDSLEENTEAVRVHVSAPGVSENNIDAWVRIINRETLVMDFNRNGKVDAEDSNLLCSAISAESADAVYDINRDGEIDESDHATLRRANRIPLGDVNWDGVFDSQDIISAFVAGTFNSDRVANWSTGDWNCDGVFDLDDLLVAFLDQRYSR